MSESVEIRIHDVGRDGQGVGFDEDKNIYFVRGAIPGDKVLLSFTGKKRYRDATLVRVTEPSADRVPPACQYFLECGGCDWQQWSYPQQLAAKEKTVAHILRRAGLQPRCQHPTIAAGAPLHYRNRIQLRKQGKRLGFSRRDSHQVVDVERCALATQEVNNELSVLRTEITAAVGSANLMAEKVELFTTPQGKVRRQYDDQHSAVGFRQVNTEQNRALQTIVRGLMGEPEASLRVVELFCGDGNLTFAYALPGMEVVAIDGHAASIQAARAGVTHAAPPIRFENVLIREGAAKAGGPGDSIETQFFQTYDTLLLDPPRIGIGARTLTSTIGPSVRKIIYVSCAPITFSQDVKNLGLLGFGFHSLQLVDMFPQTHHVELVGCFIRV